MEQKVTMNAKHLSGKGRTIRNIILSVAMSVVALGTIYLLMRPATAWTRTPQCGLEEHVHTDECYKVTVVEETRTLICGLEEAEEPHTHGDDCFVEGEPVLICTLEEGEGHVHDEACYEMNLICTLEDEEHTHEEGCYESTLICGLEETLAHTHSDECYEKEIILVCELQETHIHTDACYEIVEAHEEKELICVNVEHTHEDACYDMAPESEEGYYCGHISHVHSDVCYANKDSENGELLCGVIEEHEHTLQCQSDPKADAETEEDWSKMISELNLRDFWEQNVVAIAKSQIGYKESELNYNVISEEEGKEPAIAGYSRYGAWSGEPYAMDWNNQFAAFCVSYSKVNPEYPIVKDSTEKWKEELGTIGMYYTMDEVCKNVLPEDPEEEIDDDFDLDGLLLKAGDLLFLDTDTEDNEKIADRVAIITEIIADEEHHIVKLMVVEGDIDGEVVEKEYAIDGENILGVGEMLYNMSAVAALDAQDSIVKAEDFKKLAGAGSYTLNNDITVTGATGVTINGNVTLDLNGHKIFSECANELFKIDQNGKLTIIDSKESSETTQEIKASSETTQEIFETSYGHTAKYKDGTLTYYVTESTVTDQSLGLTHEKVVEHVVSNAGMIIGKGTGRMAWFHDGGVLTLGMNSESPVYVCNFINDENEGAAMFVQGTKTGGYTTLNLYKTVIAANHGKTGGAIALNSENSILNIYSECVISGNTAKESGGAIYSWSGTMVNMFGGYVTNNKAQDKGYFAGGGAFYLSGPMTMKNGFITGNEANGGGGIKLRRDEPAGSVYMEGGFITANHAVNAEGGGVNVDSNGTFVASASKESPIYITNNIAGGGVDDTTFQHWGGGGLFCCDNNALIVLNHALIDNNHAGGYGGGIAGCSTGRINIALTPGSAMYDNVADGEHISGSESAKNDDHTFAQTDPLFHQNGYQDYYCALSSEVHGGMLGGGTANWTGSADGEPITSHSNGDVLKAAYIMGLTAHPSDIDKANAEAHAQVYITGNQSPTHGGGILCNGYLAVGADEIPVYSRLELVAGKDLIDGSGNLINLEKRVFTFSVEDEHGVIVAIGHNDEYGRITFDRRLPFTQEGTFTYYIYENELTAEQRANELYKDVIIDQTRYKLVVNIVKNEEENAIHGSIKKTTYQFVSISISDTSRADTIVYENSNPGNDEQHAIILNTLGRNAFINHMVENVTVSVEKKWAGGVPTNVESIEVTLYQNGIPMTNSNGSNKTITLPNSEGQWKGSWTELPLGYDYTVVETTVNGYVPIYTYTYSDRDGELVYINNAARLYVLNDNVFIPANKVTENGIYMIVSPDGTHALCESGDRQNKSLEESEVLDVIIESNDTYLASVIPSEARYKAVRSDGVLILENQRVWSEKTSCLLAQANGNNYLKSADVTDWGSGVELVSTDHGYLLKMQNGQRSAGKSYTRVLVWDRTKFTTVPEDEVTVYSTQIYTSTDKNVTITNTPVQNVEFKVEIKKVSKKNPLQVLPGAEFELWTKQGEEYKLLHFVFNNTTGKYEYTADTSANVLTTLRTANNGYIRIDKLPAGEYKLVETKAPLGYKLCDPQEFSLNEGTPNQMVSITVEDEEAIFKLPETGGSGTFAFTAVGTALMLISLLLAWKRRKQEE